MGDLAIHRLRIDSKITAAHRLEEKSHRDDVVHKTVWVYTKNRRRY
jgi:hypothetical protein